jgi:hypothetical protein
VEWLKKAKPQEKIMSTSTYIMLAPATLKPGVDEKTLIAASDAFDRDFVKKQKGVLRRQLLRTKHGGYADLVTFESKEAADKVIEAEMTSPDCAKLFSLMEMPDASVPDMGVLSFELIKTYE